MANPLALAETQRIAQLRLSAQIQGAAAVAFNRQLDPRRLDATYPKYAATMTALIGEGRRASHGIAEEYWAGARANAGKTGPAPKLPVAALDADKLATSLRVTGPVSIKSNTGKGRALSESIRKARTNAVGVAKRYTLDGGRDALNATRGWDGVIGVARVSDGSPCVFCAMLVSRGPAYLSVESADFKPHGESCGCGTRVVFDTDEDGGWSPDALALKKMWDKDGPKTGNIEKFAADLAAAYADPKSAVYRAYADKLTAVVATDLAPVVVAAEAAFVTRIRELAADLPEDRSLIGAKNIALTEADVRRKMRADAESLAGGSLEELEDAIEKGTERLANLRELDHLIEQTPGITRMTKWPPELKPLADAVGIGRRQPKTSWSAVYTARNDQEVALRKMRDRVDYVRSVDALPIDPSQLVPRLVDDLTETGELGADAAKALATTREAGRVLGDEIDTRLAARGLTSPADIQETLIHAERAYKDVRRDFPFGAPETEAAWTKFDAIARKARSDLGRYREATAEVAREVLAEARPLHTGAGIKLNATNGPTGKRLQAAMQRAQETYPADWVDHAKVKLDGYALGKNNRGYFDGHGRQIMLSEKRDIDPDMYGVAIHELGHGMEHSVPGLKGLEWAFHYSRTTHVGTDGVRRYEALRDLYGNGKESSYFDDFLERYTGKSYAPPGTQGHKQYWEIFQTGVESVFEGSPYIIDTDGRVDNDLRNFILGAMSVL